MRALGPSGAAARRLGGARGTLVGVLALVLTGLIALGISEWIRSRRMLAAAAQPDFAQQMHMASLQALLVYYRDHHGGRWPEGIEELERDPSYAPFAGVYGRNLYGHPVQIEWPSEDDEPRLRSLGKDGRAGGQGEDADVEYAGVITAEWSEGAVPVLPDAVPPTR